MPVFFATESILAKCNGRLGYPDGSLFVMLEEEVQAILEAADYRLGEVCKKLSVPEAAWRGQRVFLVQVPKEELRNLRISSGNEECVDSSWLPGGVHANGFKQAVIDPVRLDACGVMEIKWKQ